MTTNYSYLLPNGMEDQLPPLAFRQNKIAQLILSKLHSFGYDMVFPPMLEYCKSFYQSLTDNEMQANCFEVSDISEDERLVIRSDITVQVARIAKQRLRQQIRPLRLCYHDKIVLKKNTRSYKREYHQIGAEIFYDDKDNLSHNLEILELLTECLEAVKLTDYKIELSFPIIIYQALEKLKIDDSNQSQDKSLKEKVQKAIIQKDLNTLKETAKQNHQIKTTVNDLIKLINFQGSACQAINNLINIPFAKEYKTKLLEIINLVEKLNKQYPKVEISFDPLELTGFSYHNGLCFNVYALGEKEEIGRGGSYSVADKNQTLVNNSKQYNQNKLLSFEESSAKENATGFSLYLENLTSLVQNNFDKGKLLLSLDQKHFANKYRKKNYRVVVYNKETSNLSDISQLARNFNFDYYLDKNNKIEKV